MKRMCSVEGCGRAYYAKSLCSAHYVRKRTTGLIGAATVRAYAQTCQVAGCEQEHEGLGFCTFHRLRHKAGIPLDMPKKEMERHGCWDLTEYGILQGMKQRCYNPKDTTYWNYGARGITICSRWRRSFRAFLADMGPRPSLAHGIDRIDTHGNYEPGNCRWATQKVNCRNSRQNVLSPTLIAELRVYVATGRSIRSWARAHGVSHAACNAAMTGKTWS